MREFVITSDSTTDLPLEYLRENGVPFASLSYVLEGKTYRDNQGLTSKEFYDKVRAGAMPTTSQINVEEARALFEPLVQEGKDILHIAFSSGLSGSCNSCRLAADMLMEEYPECRIEVVDSLCASLGEGLLLHKALQQRQKGDMDVAELAQWTRELAPYICHNFTVDDLHHLHRGGRVSKTTAVLGTLAGIKPVLHVDDAGHLVAIDKVRGRKKSLIALVDRMERQAQGFENDVVFISHGDCLEDAEFVKEQVQSRFGIEQFLINPVGAVIGSHSGPGTLALFFVGAPR